MDSEQTPAQDPYDPTAAPNNAEVWPPPPLAWPPPPGNMPETPVFFPFIYKHEKVKGNLSDFREGSLGIASWGLTLQGRAQPRAEIYQTVLILTFFFCRGFGAFIAYLIMRYGCLHNEVLQIPWNMVQGITTVPKKNKLCIVYNAANNAGKVATYSLAMRFPPEMFMALNQIADQYAPGLAKPGRLKSGTPLIGIVLLVLLLGTIAIGAIKFLSSPSPQP